MKQLFFDEDIKYLFNGSKSFDLAQKVEGEIYREHANRITKKIIVNHKGYFIKLHAPVGWREIFKNLIQIKIPVIGATRELKALNHLAYHGINTLSVIGYFKRGIIPAYSQSFLITKELNKTISLEDFFMEGLHKKLSFKHKRFLLEKIAETLRKIHLSGMNHRDLYLCHLHIKKDYNFNDLKIYVIDLHRAQIRKNVPERWLVKDLGGFLHSTMGFGLTERDYYRFFKTYFNCSLESLSSTHTLLLKKIFKRAFLMYLKPKIKPFKYSASINFSEGSNYSKAQDDTGRWLYKKSGPVKKIMGLIKDEDLLIKEGMIIKDEEGHLIVKVKIDEQNYFFKKYRIKNAIHGFSRLFKKTRAYNSWIAFNWLTAVGLHAAEPTLIFIENGFLGNRHSFLVTKEIKGQRLDDALSNSANFDTITSGISGFFKRLRWINFKHGDAKTSNFFISGKNIIALDLDTAGYENFFSRFNGLSRDKKRLLKSIANYPKLHKKLFKRI